MNDGKARTHPNPNHPRKGYAGGVPAATQRPFRSPLEGEGANANGGKARAKPNLIQPSPTGGRNNCSSPFKGEVGRGMGLFISTCRR